MSADAAHAGLNAVRARVDAFVADAERAQAPHLKCGAACAMCCKVERAAFAVEVDSVRRWLGEHPEVRASAQARPRRSDRCAFLNDDDLCDVYPVRPMICRTHGPAVRVDEALAWCALNFAGLSVPEVEAAVPASSVLSVELVNRMLVVVNTQFVEAAGGPHRVALREALADAVESSS